MSCRTLSTRPVFFDPTVTCSQPRNVPTTSTVRSTVRCSRGATVTGTVLTRLVPLAEASAPDCEQPDWPRASTVPRTDIAILNGHLVMVWFRYSNPRPHIEASQQVAHEGAGQIL